MDTKKKSGVIDEADLQKIIDEMYARPVRMGEDNPFPIQAFPPVIRNLAESFSKTWEVPPELFAIPALSVISASVGKWVEVMSDKGEPLGANLFNYLSVPSAGAKSRAFSEAMAPVIEVNSERRELHRMVIKPEVLGRIESIGASISSEKKKATGQPIPPTLDFSEHYKELAALERRKKFWSIQSSDFTVEALIKKGSVTKSLFIATDEASIVQNIIAGRYSDGFTNEGFFCRLFSGSPYDRDRATDDDGSTSADGTPGTMMLMGQPHITKMMFEDPRMKESGFIPRFLFGAISYDLKEDNRNAPPICDRARTAYRKLVRKLLEDYWLTWEEQLEAESEGVDFREEITTLKLSRGALDVLHSFKTSLVMSHYANRIDSLNSVIGRLKEQAMRVCAVLHFAEYGMTKKGDAPSMRDREISQETALNAIAIVRWSFGQYMAYSEGTHAKQLDGLEKKVLAFVKEQGEATARQVARKFQADFGGVASRAEVVLQRLRAKGKATEVPVDANSTGGRPTTRYRAA